MVKKRSFFTMKNRAAVKNNAGYSMPRKISCIDHTRNINSPARGRQMNEQDRTSVVT